MTLPGRVDISWQRNKIGVVQTNRRVIHRFDCHAPISTYMHVCISIALEERSIENLLVFTVHIGVHCDSGNGDPATGDPFCLGQRADMHCALYRGGPLTVNGSCNSFLGIIIEIRMACLKCHFHIVLEGQVNQCTRRFVILDEFLRGRKLDVGFFLGHVRIPFILAFRAYPPQRTLHLGQGTVIGIDRPGSIREDRRVIIQRAQRCYVIGCVDRALKHLDGTAA